MADAQEPTTNIPAPAAASAPSESPVVVTPSASVEAEASSVSNTADTATVVSPVTEPEKVETAVENVLGDTKPVDVKTEVVEKKAEAKPEGDKATETKVETPSEAKVELPVYEEFKLPENIKLEKEPLDAFTRILGEIETGKLDHKSMQEKGQALIDLAAKATVDSINRLNDSYVQIHQQNQKARFEALKADPELGGEKLSDTIATLQNSIKEYGGTEQQVAEFRKDVTEAGLGASPAICRLIHNMQRKIDSYTKESPGGQVPASRPAPSKVKPYQTFYGSNNG